MLTELAFHADDFENHLNGQIGGIVKEYIKWKTAEALKKDISSWKSEVDTLSDAFVAWYFEHDLKGKTQKASDRAKEKVLHKVFAHAIRKEPTYYTFALNELRKKLDRDLRKEDLYPNTSQEVIELIKEKIRELRSLSEEIDEWGFPKNS